MTDSKLMLNFDAQSRKASLQMPEIGRVLLKYISYLSSVWRPLSY